MNNSIPWWKKSVVYQIYPKSFFDTNEDGYGDLNGIREKLPYLKKLGIDVIWLNPIYVSPQVDNGYDISGYKDIEPTLGTMKDFDSLLMEAHGQGIRIILDLVVNHTSDQHPWFVEAKKSVDNSYHDYYIWKDKKGDELPNNWGSSFGGSTWEYVEETAQYYLHLFAKEQPDLNWENPKVRAEVYEILRFWLDKGIDGFRMDVISLISKKQEYPDGPVIQNKAFGSYYSGSSNGPRVHEFIKEMNQEVLCKYDIMTVGETPNTTSEQAKLFTGSGREELNMVFHFDHMHLDYGEDGKYSRVRFKLTDLKKVMTEWQDAMYDCGGWNSLYWSNHDQARVVSRFGNDTSEYREASAKMLGTVLHMLQGTPYIYEGEEIGMTNAYFQDIAEYKDVEALDIYNDFTVRKGKSSQETLELLGMKSRDNARTPMQWNDESEAGFTTGMPWIHVNSNYKEINVERALNDKNSVFYYYQKLIKLRHEYDIITTGKYKIFDEDNEQVYAYARTGKNQKLIVIGNFTCTEIDYKIKLNEDWKTCKLLISNDNSAKEQLQENVTLLPYGAYVYLLENE